MKKVAVIGAGHWGKNLVKNFYELNALAAVAEPSLSIREELKTKFPEVSFFDDYRWILKSDIPSVVIATPVATHFSIAREALLAGKDVFVEKPITLSVQEAKELDKLARLNGRILMVGHLLLYQPAIQWIKRYLEYGELGELYSLHQRRLKLGRARSYEDVLWSFGVHDIAVLLYLVGKEPTEISVQGQRVLQPHIDDDVFLHMSFDGKINAHLHTSWLWPIQERRLVLVGSKGMLIYDETEQTVILHRKGINPDLSNRDGGDEVVYKGDDQPLKVECLHFLDCIENRMSPISNGKNGIAVVRVLEKAMHAMKGGVMV